MANVHLFLQAKGGAGKSFSATMLTNYKLDCTDMKPVCIDTDPSNATYSAYPRFEAKRIDIMKGEIIDALCFDRIIQIIEKTSGDDTVIIDNGASSFIAFADYLLSNDVPSLLHEMGHQLYINTIVTGGDSQSDTVHGFIG